MTGNVKNRSGLGCSLYLTLENGIYTLKMKIVNWYIIKLSTILKLFIFKLSEQLYRMFTKGRKTGIEDVILLD